VFTPEFWESKTRRGKGKRKRKENKSKRKKKKTGNKELSTFCILV